eukprot:11121970-Ditylum_brightwellii.AAC.1
MKTLLPPPITSHVTNKDAPQTPMQVSALLGTSHVTETVNNSATVTKEVNNSVAIAREIAEEGEFCVDDVFHDGEDSIYHRVETIRNAVMVKKELNICNRCDIKNVTVNDYIEFMSILDITSYENATDMQYTFARLSLKCHDIFKFHVDSIPQDPGKTSPMNDIALAYIAAVTYHKTLLKKSTDNPTKATPHTSKTPNSTNSNAPPAKANAMPGSDKA